MKKKISPFLVSFLIAGLFSCLLLAIEPGQSPVLFWIKSALFISVLLYILICAIKTLQINTSATNATWIALIVRVALGLILFAALPIWGHNEDAPRAGYLYLDAYRRNSQAWSLAQSGRPLWAAFQADFYADQYGGMLAISALLYRTISSDAQRPTLVIFLCSFVAALGIPFLWSVVRKKWGENVATLCAWILCLYPESVVLGSAQMREPILIGLSGIAIWGVGFWKEDRKSAIFAISASMLSMAAISLRAAVVMAVFLAIWFLLENLNPDFKRNQRLFFSSLLFLCAIVGLALTANWLIESARYDLFLMESSSGRIQNELDKVSGTWRVPFIVGYGVLQPVLPATLIYPSLALMQAISIYRAVGWYLLAPLIILSFFHIWRTEKKRDRWLFLWMLVFSIVWIFVSSLRAGGDQWDNVRYRTIALPIMAIVASYAYFRQKEKPTIWFGRIIALEIFFILVFLHWYVSRYIEIWERLPFWQMILLIIVCSAIFIVICIIYDILKKRKKNSVGNLGDAGN